MSSHFPSPVHNRYFEDYIVGSVHEFGAVPVNELDVIDFGNRFVPLPYHTDPEAAKKSIYGGLIASGWHTAAMMMRLYTDHYLSQAANLGSPGGDELRWTKPVFPGDELSIRVTVLDTRRSDSKPDRGIVQSFVEVLNQKREVVMSVKMANFVRRRGAANDPSVSH
jgi:acyl dehydratase